MELPPHARRRDPDAISARANKGITSACAEKSRKLAKSTIASGNYLRMRGEEITVDHDGGRVVELPPHARRRAALIDDIPTLEGITSACAEKSFVFNLS